jgi:hypothetical protein
VSHNGVRPGFVLKRTYGRRTGEGGVRKSQTLSPRSLARDAAANKNTRRSRAAAAVAM